MNRGIRNRTEVEGKRPQLIDLRDICQVMANLSNFISTTSGK